VVSREVSFHCGFSSIPFTYFASAIIFFATAVSKVGSETRQEDFYDPIKGPKLIRILTNLMNPKAGSMVGAHRRYHRDPHSHETLIQLLQRANAVNASLNSLRATDPRDRIFGMLGLASDTDQLQIRPDYSKSKTCEAVYTDAARALFQNGHTDVLALSQFPKQYSNLPTWVPDWTTTIQEPCGLYLSNAYFSASGQMSFCYVPTVFTGAERLIALKGVRVDIITQVGQLWLPTIVNYEHNWAHAMKFISDIESFCSQSDRIARPIYRSPTQRAEAIWRIPCEDLDRLDEFVRSRARTTGPDLEEGFKLLTAGLGSEECRSSKDPRLHSYTTCMGDMFKRRPFLSAEGYVGLAPSHAEPGDVIVIIYGAIVPFILRNVGDGQFNLVGEAYVHGIMVGEYMEQNPLTETFVLS
jgi:hypothetical protein